MAYAALLSLTQTLERILGSRPEEKQIKSLHEKLSFLLSFLDDSSPKNTESMTRLEARIRDATYEAEDIIELHMSKEILSDGLQKVIQEIDSILVDVEKMIDMNDIEGSSKSSSNYKSAVVGFNNDSMQINVPLGGPPPEFKSTSIDGIEDIGEVVKTNEQNEVKDLQLRNSMRAISSKSTFTKKITMVGFEDDLLQIKEELVGQSSRLKIISIVGMGGIGKTTLASNIYNDSYIKHHFHIRAWTTLSQEYHVRELLVDLLKSMGDFVDEMNQKETDQLKTRVYQRLRGNKYLIVMDDVWDVKALDELTRIFPDDNNGSRIILTTRLSSIAVNADSSGPIHHLSFLSPEQSWNLLCQKAFGKEWCPSELEEIGRRIAEKCKGLPLALVVIGGVLYKAEKTRANWEYVAENVKSAVTGSYDDFMEILSWSYNHLPHRLRACFLYMGVFPEDYVIHVTHLIRLWVAEGFIKSITHNNLEEVAKEYLEELIDRNLIMVRHWICTGEIITCSIHDIMRELCVRKAQKEKFLHITDQKVEISTELMKNQRHLSIHREMRYDLSDINDSTIRSLLYFTDSLLPNSLCFQLLRVLEAGNIIFSEFPIEIVKLVNLRYIALSYTGIFKIPVSIAKLCNLQTLMVFRNSKGKILLPEELLKMPQLRHLLFDEAVLLCSDGPQNANLQELSGVIDFRFTQEALQIIPNLKTLGISYYCDRETGLSLYCLENLVLLQQLESLKCNFWRHIPLLQNLAFPPNLKKLTLSGCRISWRNMSLVGSLPNLEILKLKHVVFENTSWKTKEREFSQLKFLLVERNLLEFWEAEAAHFPSLQILCLRHCPFLNCIPSEIGEILSPQLIIVYECRLSVFISANSILEEQQELGNDYLEVHAYSYLDKYETSHGISNRKMYTVYEKHIKATRERSYIARHRRLEEKSEMPSKQYYRFWRKALD